MQNLASNGNWLLALKRYSTSGFTSKSNLFEPSEAFLGTIPTNSQFASCYRSCIEALLKLFCDSIRNWLDTLKTMKEMVIKNHPILVTTEYKLS